jgi:hypothetical protein
MILYFIYNIKSEQCQCEGIPNYVQFSWLNSKLYVLQLDLSKRWGFSFILRDIQCCNLWHGSWEFHMVTELVYYKRTGKGHQTSMSFNKIKYFLTYFSIITGNWIIKCPGIKFWSVVITCTILSQKIHSITNYITGEPHRSPSVFRCSGGRCIRHKCKWYTWNWISLFNLQV